MSTTRRGFLGACASLLAYVPFLGTAKAATVVAPLAVQPINPYASMLITPDGWSSIFLRRGTYLCIGGKPIMRGDDCTFYFKRGPAADMFQVLPEEGFNRDS